jgi:hypothetical protein
LPLIESMSPMKAAAQIIKISPTGKEILDFLRSRGGTSSVGIIGSNRSTTIRHLRRLEALGLVECLSEPERFKPRPDAIGIEGVSLTCGVWQIMTVPAAVEKVRTCSFCGFKAPYGDFPEGSVCFLGICACGTCLERVETEDFRALLAEEEAINRNAQNTLEKII